jgi:trk system potassium uptake protein TrkA
MNVVIAGAGAVGFQLARQLVDTGHDVVLIEKDRGQANYVTSRLDCMVVNNVGNNLSVLRSAGCETADFFIAVTDSDEVNMIACALVQSEFPDIKTVARVRNLDYGTEKITNRQMLGIDYIVNPEIEAARAIIQSIRRGALSDVMLFQHAQLQIRPVSVTADSLFCDQTLQQAAGQLTVPFLIATVMRDNTYIVPSGDTILRSGDILYLVASEEDFDMIFQRLGKVKHTLRRIIIVGGGKVGVEVARYLLTDDTRSHGFMRFFRSLRSAKKSVNVRIVERDYERCKALTEQFPAALVVNADISNEEIFDEERFADADLIVAATENQELNIVSGLYGHSLGIRRTIALVKQAGYARIATNLGIDVAISFKENMVNSILTYMRRGHVSSVHSVADGRIEILELPVSKQSRGADKPIREITLPAGSLILAVARGESNVIPTGDYRIQAGDHIVVITGKEHVDRVQEIFTGS